MAPWQLLEAREEDELHKARLLNVEEKPFKRITKRVQTLYSLAKLGRSAAPDAGQRQNGVSKAPSRPSTPTTAPAVGDSAVDIDETGGGVDTEQLAHLRDELTLDFAAFDSTIGRLQFLATANAAERARYTADRQAILDTCQSVRENNATLRVTLEDAKAALERRRKLDDLAEKITSNRMLKPRADQRANLAKLEEECAQLEEESETYAVTWRERRDQFARIMEESMRLRRQIRDEKEEVDRREGMGEEDNEDRGGDDAPTPRPGVASGNATPVPGHHAGGGGGGIGSSSLASKMMLAGMDSQDPTPSRPASTTGGRTPARDSPGPSQDLLKPRPDTQSGGGGGFGSASQAGSTGSRPASREGSGGAAAATTPAATAGATLGANGDDEVDEGEDVEMDDAAGRAAGTGTGGAEDTPMNDTQTTTDNTPRITVDGQEVAADQMDTT